MAHRLNLLWQSLKVLLSSLPSRQTLLLRLRGLYQAAKPSFFLALSLTLLTITAFAEEDAGGRPFSIEKALEEASTKKLHEKREWRVLLHYRGSFLKGYESLIDDPDFFLSPHGKNDPKSELEATLKSFYREGPLDDTHTQCRFIARYRWLKGELGFEGEPTAHCKDFEELYTNLKPTSAVLIFPVAYMNSPASMFGHTLLRLDSSVQSQYLSYAVNYSAFTDETNGVLFAVKGIFGFYEGFFSLLPYYEKIKEYSSLENRDMWEIRLNLTPVEVERMFLHMWELKDIYAWYYFFDENCSYNLLLVLEAARPEADLLARLPGWVIPMDTIKAVEEAGLSTGEASYRPSKATKIKHIKGLMDERQQALSEEVAGRNMEPQKVVEEIGLDVPEKVRTLDLAVEYLQFLYARKKLTKDEYLKSYLKILSARSRLGITAPYDIAAPIPPQDGHGAARVTLGAGVKAGAAYNYLALRPANHDLLDPDGGYINGAAITFMEGELRYNYTERKLSLERLTLVEINSISPIDRFFRPVSWKIAAGLFREEFEKRGHRSVFRVYGGPGASVEAGGGLLYSFIEPEVKFNGGLEDGYSFGGAFSAGYLKPLTEAWKAQLQLKAASFFLGESHNIYTAELNQRYTIGQNSALRLNLKREGFDGFYSNEANLGISWYF